MEYLIVGLFVILLIANVRDERYRSRVLASHEQLRRLVGDLKIVLQTPVDVDKTQGEAELKEANRYMEEAWQLIDAERETACGEDGVELDLEKVERLSNRGTYHAELGLKILGVFGRVSAVVAEPERAEKSNELSPAQQLLNAGQLELEGLQAAQLELEVAEQWMRLIRLKHALESGLAKRDGSWRNAVAHAEIGLNSGSKGSEDPV